MIQIKSFARKKNNGTSINSGGGFNYGSSTTSNTSLDTHYFWGQPYNGTQDVNGDLTSNGKVTANEISGASISGNSINAANVTATNVSATTSIATTLNFDTATGADIYGDYVVTDDLGAATATIDSLISDEAEIGDIEGTNLSYSSITTNQLQGGNATLENLTVTKSATFFELIIDKVKSAGGSILLTPSDGFKVDKVESESIKYADSIVYGNGEGTNDMLSNYFSPLGDFTVQLDVEGNNYVSSSFTRNTESSFSYDIQETGVLLFHIYGLWNWSNTKWEISNDGVSYRTVTNLVYKQSRRITNGEYINANDNNYRVYSFLVKQGQKFRFTGTCAGSTVLSRTIGAMVVPNKYGVEDKVTYDNIHYEVSVNNPNLYHLPSTQDTNQRRVLMYATGEVGTNAYGDPNIFFVSPYIDVTDVSTIDVKFGGLSTSTASNLCAYDEDYNYIQSNSLNNASVTTTWVKGENTKYIRFTARWTYEQQDTENPDGYYIYLNGNRTQPQIVKYNAAGSVPFANINYVKVDVDYKNNIYKSSDYNIFNGLPCADWNGNGGLYDSVNNKNIWGALDNYKSVGVKEETIETFGGKKLYWKTSDGTNSIQNMWKVNDQAICQTFNAAEGTNYNASNKYYWALVSETGTETIDGEDYHYIKFDGTDYVGDLNCEVGDEIVQLGYRGNDDSSRQSALYLAAYNSIDTGVTAPLIAQYEGINDFNLASHRKTWFASNGNEVRGNLKITTSSGDISVNDAILNVTNQQITAAAEQILLDVKDLLVDGDVTINGLITNVSQHINQYSLTQSDAVVIDLLNNKNVTVERIETGVTIPLVNNQIVYLPYYDSMYNDNPSFVIMSEPQVTASAFGFTSSGLTFEDSGITFNVPTYKTEGTQLRITNSFVPTLNNWQNYKSIYSASTSQQTALYEQLLTSCVILVADPRLLSYKNYTRYWDSTINGSTVFNTPYGQQTSVTNPLDASHSGAFLFNGLRSRFLYLLPSQSVNLRSQIVNYGNGRRVLNWIIENTSDFQPIETTMGIKYDNDTFTWDFKEIINGTTWQTQYTQVNDILIGNGAISAASLSSDSVYPVIRVINNTIASNGIVPYVESYEYNGDFG